MTPGIRIGELARRTGLTPDVLRVWERRFGLFSPRRSEGGYRLYTADDERLAHDVIALKSRGVPLSVAVDQALQNLHRAQEIVAEGAGPVAHEIVRDIDLAVRGLDQVGTSAAVLRAIETLGPERAMVEVLLPYLEQLGEQWERGEVTVAHEHFASHTIRRHVGALGAELASSGRRTAIVACPPGERHDIGALMTAVALSRRGWSVRFLGGDTPVAAIDTAAVAARADVVVLGATRRSVLEAVVPLVSRLRAVAIVAIGGAGTDEEIARRLGATLLPMDPVQAVGCLDDVVASARDSA